MSKPKPTCVYCGEAEGNSVDHVPPKLLFPSPRPDNLITVPSCRACNQGFQRDDEYFQAAMLLRSDIAKEPEAKAIMETFFRSWERPRGERFARSFFRTFQIAEWQTPSGLFAGNTPAFEVENKRLQRVYERIVRGLFFHEQGFRVPDDYRVETMLWVEERPNLLRALPRYFRGRPIRRIGGVFTYTCVFGENPAISLWLFNFYRHALTMIRTSPAVPSPSRME